MITFCNQAYWPFSHGMLQSMQFVAPALIPFWTVIVADEPTRQFVMKQAPGVDVFVDRDLQDIVASADAADVGSLTKLLLATHARPAQPHPGGFHRRLPRAGRGVHEESAAAVHDMLVDADVVATSDYGIGAEGAYATSTPR